MRNGCSNGLQIGQSGHGLLDVGEFPESLATFRLDNFGHINADLICHLGDKTFPAKKTWNVHIWTFVWPHFRNFLKYRHRAAIFPFGLNLDLKILQTKLKLKSSMNFLMSHNYFLSSRDQSDWSEWALWPKFLFFRYLYAVLGDGGLFAFMVASCFWVRSLAHLMPFLGWHLSCCTEYLRPPGHRLSYSAF